MLSYNFAKDRMPRQEEDHLFSVSVSWQCFLTTVLQVLGVADKRPKYNWGLLKNGAGQLLHGSIGTFKHEFKYVLQMWEAIILFMIFEDVIFLLFVFVLSITTFCTLPRTTGQHFVYQYFCDSSCISVIFAAGIMTGVHLLPFQNTKLWK